ncbi:MAG: LLM class flavin-dependent oxidoreductase, partial [Angustibacter sp.]
FAKELMSLDDVSGGRFVLGVGAGGTGWDASVLGQAELTPRERVERLDEFVALLDLLLTQPSTTWRGDWFEAVEARMVPGPLASRPPFVVAANGPKAMRVAATRGDAWATTGPGAADGDQDAWWRGVGELGRRFDDALAAAGRDAGSVRRYLNLDSGAVFSLTSAEVFADALGRAEELGFTDVVTHWPRAEGVYAADERVLEQVADRLS